MLKQGILHPEVLALLARFRHTNTLVIADRGFPSWPRVATIDLSLVDDVPTVAQVLGAVLASCVVGAAFMAREFKVQNSALTVNSREKLLRAHGVALRYERHGQFKKRVPGAIGLIRTADTIPYANIILESA